MIFFILNLLLGIGMILFSMYVDSDDREIKSRSFVNLILSLGVVIFFIVCIFLSMFWKNNQLVNLSFRLMYISIAIFMSTFTGYCVRFPEFKHSKLLSVLRYILIFASIVFVWKIERISITSETGIVINSSESFLKGLTWFQVYKICFLQVLPFVAVLGLFVGVFRKSGKIFRQQQLLMIGGIITAYVFYSLVMAASKFIPFYTMLFPFCMASGLAIFYASSRLSVVIDFTTISKSLITISVTYLFPALLAGILFALMFSYRVSSPVLFLLVFITVTLLLISLHKNIEAKLREKQFSRISDYEDTLEEKISAFDYNESSETLLENFTALMKMYTETTSVEILLDDDLGMVKSVFSSNQEPSGSIPSNEGIIDSLAGTNRTVILKTQAANLHEFFAYRKNLIQLFTILDADAIILLRESRHLFGIIAFGVKRRGNDFNEYDYRVFSNLYSYFFLFGFYMKNIANQALVGTVDREIQFSSQVIRSIQDNVDRINNPSIDVGYISQSARSLGGDFIDFIRLTDTRYMMIMGDVSGKGLNASMSMVILKSIIRTLLSETGDFKELIEKVNYFIKYNLPRGTFFAGVFAIFDFTENLFYYVNCGLPVLFLYTEAYNNVIEIQGEGKVLGFVRKISGLIKVRKIKLNPGDVVLACTDGLLDSESLRGEMYGKDRVQKLILENKTFDSSRLVRFVLDDMLQFTSKELQDDVTAIAIRMIRPQE